MGKLDIPLGRIGTSSPTFSLHDFRKMYLRISRDFRLWEIAAEGEHHSRIIEESAKELLSSHPIKLQIHAPLSDINIGSINERIRKASVAEVVGSIRLASLLDAGPVTFHPGHFSPLSVHEQERLFGQTKISLGEIDRTAEDYGVEACMENTPNFIFTRYQTPEELLGAIDGTGLSLTLDVGHANTADQLKAFLCPEILEKVGNVHLHDNVGKGDEHLTPGDGAIDFPWVIGRLEEMGYKGNYILESNSYESSLKGKEFMIGL